MEAITDANKGMKVKIRPLCCRDLTEIVSAVRRESKVRWRGWEFLACVRPTELLGYVAEMRDGFSGFVLCTPLRHNDETSTTRFAALRTFCRRLMGWRGRTAVSFDLLDVLVCGDGAPPELERVLLEQLDRELRSLGSPVRLVVPETKLRTQLFLRAAGYLATRVLHDYFGNEDGFLMQRHECGGTENVASRKSVESSAREAVPSAS